MRQLHLEVGRDRGGGPGVRVVVRALVAETGRECRRAGGCARAVHVGLGLGLVVVDPVENGSKDLPGNVELIVTDKVRAVALERVEDKSLVRLGNLDVGEAVLVGHVKLDRNSLGDKTRKLVVELEVDGLVRLDTKNELVADNVREDARRNVLELDTDLDLGLIESCRQSTARSDLLTLACLHNERNALPAGVVDEQGESGERGATRALGDSVVVKVARLAVASNVLAEENVLLLDGRDGAEDLDLKALE